MTVTAKFNTYHDTTDFIVWIKARGYNFVTDYAAVAVNNVVQYVVVYDLHN